MSEVVIKNYILRINRKNRLVSAKKIGVDTISDEELLHIHPEEVINYDERRVLEGPAIADLYRLLYPIYEGSIPISPILLTTDTSEYFVSENRSMLFDIGYRGIEGNNFRENLQDLKVLKCNTMIPLHAYLSDKLSIVKSREPMSYMGDKHFYPLPIKSNEMPLEFPILPLLKPSRDTRVLLDIERTVEIPKEYSSDPELFDQLPIEEMLEVSRRINGNSCCFYTLYNIFTSLYIIAKVQGHVVHYRPRVFSDCLLFLKDAFQARIQNVIIHLDEGFDLNQVLGEMNDYINELRLSFS